MKPKAIAMAVVGLVLALVCTDAAVAQCLGGKCGTKTVTRSRTVTRSSGSAIGIYLPQRLAAQPTPDTPPVPRRAAPPTAEQVPTPAPADTAPATAAPARTKSRSKSVLKSRTTSRPVPVYLQPVWCAPPPPMIWVPVYSYCPW